MIPRVSSLVILMTLLWVGSLWSGSSKPPGGLRIHLQVGGEMQASSQTTRITLANPEETITVSVLPDITEHHITEVKAVHKGDEMGMMVKFNNRGTALLNNMTIEGQGRVMVVYLNNRMIYTPLIDSVIGDGVLIIPSGVTPQDMESMEAILKKLKSS